jgi:hypothetical protein
MVDDRQELHDVKLSRELGGQNIFYCMSSSNRTKACPLLLANRQLHAETISVRDILPSKLHELDVLIKMKVSYGVRDHCIDSY